MLVISVSIVSPMVSEAKCTCYTKKVKVVKKKKKKCKCKTYKIKYKLNGGKNAKSNPKVVKKNKTIKLQTPTRAGYKFNGWYIKKCAHVTKKVSKVKVTKNITLYAKWKKIPPVPVYTITYRGAGSNGNATSVKSGTVITLKATSDTKRGYSFGGWLVNGVVTPSIRVTGNIVADAKWDLVTYRVNLKNREGSRVLKYNINTELTLPREKSYDGATFVGYYTKPNGEGKYINKIPKGSTGNVSLYAHYIRDNVTTVNAVEVYSVCKGCGARSSKTFYRSVDGGTYYTADGRIVLESDVNSALIENTACGCETRNVWIKTGNTVTLEIIK